MTDADVDVIVVGAGLAGLRAATGVRARGLTVRVLEREASPGGRIRTDIVDGFRCDRGFQLLNPSYPAVQRHVDVAALNLRTSGRGVRTVDGSGRVSTLADPTRHPRLLPTTIRSAYDVGLLRPRAVAGAVRWALPAVGSVRRLGAAPDAGLGDDWDRLGVQGPIRDAVLAPFLSSVLADGIGSTSDRYVRLVLRSFLRATPGVPATGMQALPRQLAAPLREDIRYETVVEDVIDGPSPSVRTAGGETLRARAVVVAAEAPVAGALTGQACARMRGLSTWWFAADGLSSDQFLRVSGSGGPVVNTAQLSAFAPEYAPPGRVLVQATTLLDQDGPAPESQVRGEVSRIWGASAAEWELLIRHDVYDALPEQVPGTPLQRPLRVGERIVLAGDHRDTPSIQGALVSGGRAASEVARLLA
ncbi:FAD-dependent oxidoreductase [Williamsia maris]|uniref:FAD-dependent oxidoreductase n=1 Tax=Williamsia maris TaxID=72806 RepID=UPI0020A4E637|nr:FAD-dependent oxidoreductase [Williamsia maris]